jgi:hypothetical protein
MGGTPASAQVSGGHVRPHQSFIGLVNGRTGTTGRVTIHMACFGAVYPGETGHPTAGQSVGVMWTKANVKGSGYTGSTGTAIGGFFRAPPPVKAPVTSTGSVIFHRYVTLKLPVSLVLPCAGIDTVTFVALPLNPTQRSFEVPVSFVGEP